MVHIPSRLMWPRFSNQTTIVNNNYYGGCPMPPRHSFGMPSMPMFYGYSHHCCGGSNPLKFLLLANMLNTNNFGGYYTCNNNLLNYYS